MIKKWFLLITLFLIVIISAYGQSLFENNITKPDSVKNRTIEFNGYARASAFGGTKLYDYSSVFGEFCLKSKLSKNGTFLYADLRFRKGLNFDKEYSDFQLKEVYAGYQSNQFDLFLGNQIVTWGRTDGFNPTNNITPNDYFFLTSDFDDQKLSNFMLRMKYRFTPVIEIELIGIPFYSPSVYRYDLFNINGNVIYDKAILPEKTFKNASAATRLNFEFPKIGFSVSYFRGYNPFSGFNVQSIDWSTGTPLITNAATAYLKNTGGLDFALPINSWIIRGEAAYNITENYDRNMYIPNPDISYVIGLEHCFWGITTIFQYVGKYTVDFSELSEPVLPNPSNTAAQMQYAEDMIIYKSSIFNRKMFYQQEETNRAVVLSLNKDFFYDKCKIELVGYYNITSEELMIRPKITGKITDMLSASIGGSYMKGPKNSIFNYSAPVLSGFFTELKANF